MDFTLRPMSTSEVLDRMFYLYRQNFVLFAGIAIFPAAALLLINLLQVSANVTPGVVGMPRFGVGTGVGILLLFVVYLITAVMSSASTVYALSMVHLGKTTSIGESYKNIRPYFWKLVRLGMLLFVILLALFLLLALPIGLTVAMQFRWLAVPLIFAAVAVVVHLYARFSFSTAACVLENAGAVQSIQRSLFLTKGRSGRVWLVLILTVIINWALAFAIVFPISLAGSATHSLLALQIGSSIGQFLATVLASPILAISFVLLYYDERVRKEAFDLQYMMAAMEQPNQQQAAIAGQ
jgi:hypothetical protein